MAQVKITWLAGRVLRSRFERGKCECLLVAHVRQDLDDDQTQATGIVKIGKADGGG